MRTEAYSFSMTITVTLPEDLHSRPAAAREALEAFAIEGYRTGALTPRETCEMLGFETRYQLDGFLKAHDVDEFSYDIADYEKDMAAIARLGLDRRR